MVSNINIKKIMAKRVITKIGDVFIVNIGKTQKYFQYIANDLTMMNSSVIRVFKKEYPKGHSPSLIDIISDDIDFYAHVVLRWGIQSGLWEKVGHIQDVGQIDNILFRCSKDYGVGANGKHIEISSRWEVWRINDEEMHYVGKLKGKNRNADIGDIIPPYLIVDRMKNGMYSFYYPKFE